LAGIRPDAEHPGYRHVTIAPQQGLAETLSWVKASVPTPYGPISVEWRGKELQVDLPVGVTADVVWGTNQTTVKAGHWKFKKD
jgi:alpha-L-rhamnosidase